MNLANLQEPLQKCGEVSYGMSLRLSSKYKPKIKYHLPPITITGLVRLLMQPPIPCADTDADAVLHVSLMSYPNILSLVVSPPPYLVSYLHASSFCPTPRMFHRNGLG
jgi:hypothetical protein